MVAGFSPAARKEGKMKGYLDTEQLKTMKREDLQDLAKKLGVKAGGKNEEIIQRIVSVEVDVPEEEELTEEEKKACQEVAAEGAQEAAGTGEEDESEGRAEAQQNAGEEATEAHNMVRVKILTRFLDKRLNQIKEPGETYQVDAERAKELETAGVAEIER